MGNNRLCGCGLISKRGHFTERAWLRNGTDATSKSTRHAGAKACARLGSGCAARRGRARVIWRDKQTVAELTAPKAGASQSRAMEARVNQVEFRLPWNVAQSKPTSTAAGVWQFDYRAMAIEIIGAAEAADSSLGTADTGQKPTMRVRPQLKNRSPHSCR
jgi:hypothetical protein